MTDAVILESIEDAAVSLLSNCENVNSEIIGKKVEAISRIQVQNGITKEEQDLLVRRIEEKFDIRMGLGAEVAEPFEPWLDAARKDIEPYYWRRYKRYLGQAGFPPLVIGSLDQITDRILGLLENPLKAGSWRRKGLIVGHVQSGKTANYTGLICKAADAGYRLIIVMAGIHNNLRNQTQQRIDAGFVGMDSSKRLNNVGMEEKLTGVGRIDHQRLPGTFTNSTQDFKAQIAAQLGLTLDSMKEPVVLVIKKNKYTLENLTKWLTNNNLRIGSEIIDNPMLLVDDEADNASINTSKEFEEATTINRLIRNLLNNFGKSCYLGYTATPFANIFIDPDSDDDMCGDDLFPRDFIRSLDAPDNYIGSEKIFGDPPDPDIVREIDDYEDLLPLKHKKEHRPPELPWSLYDAVRAFVIVRACRLHRGQTNVHNSMLVNVSRFTDVQSHIRGLIHLYLDVLGEAITANYALTVDEALRNIVMRHLHDTWRREFKNGQQSWEEVQRLLHHAVSPVKVVEVNSSRNAEPLLYSEYRDGLNVIAVGGLSLSRGLTLEGLTVSYFLRNSIMYDTLMQMGRWFGYRDGYADLCRIYMTGEAVSWYQHIASAAEELRDEFVRMDRANLTPKDFGLAVRSHPDSLIVTARNKMRSGQTVTRSISLEGKLVESAVLYNEQDRLDRNMQTLQRLVSSIEESSIPEKLGGNWLWHDVDSSEIVDFVYAFEVHPASLVTQREPLAKYIQWLKNNQGIDRWDVAIVSVGNAKSSREKGSTVTMGSRQITSQIRTVSVTPDGKGWEISGQKRRVASKGAEKTGLEEDVVTAAEAKYRDNAEPGKGKNIPDWVYREARTVPLLMLHVLDCRKSKDELPLKTGVPAYGISFPGKRGPHRDMLVEYVVNTTWWKNYYGDDMEDEEMNGDE